MSSQPYFKNLKNGENYILKSETYYVTSKRLIKGDAEMVVLLLAITKTFINHLFCKALSQKAFCFNFIIICWNKKFFPLSTIFIKWKDILLKIICSSIYILTEDLIFRYTPHFFQGRQFISDQF